MRPTHSKARDKDSNPVRFARGEKMKDFLEWLHPFKVAKLAYKNLGWPGLFIWISAVGGLVVSVGLMVLIGLGVIP